VIFGLIIAAIIRKNRLSQRRPGHPLVPPLPAR
jgi:hypothetical protein